MRMIRILLVDDHDLFRAALRSRLEQENGIAVIGQAGTAQRAIAAAGRLQPDVILLDLVLPGRSGHDAIRDLLKVSPSGKILVVSSQTQPIAIRQAIAAGARGYITKRASDIELLAAIRRVASGARYVDPDLGANLAVTGGAAALEPISDRERDVLHMLALGHTNQEIGKRLFVSVRTVETHRAHIMRKLDLETRAELVLFALANGLIGAA
jgi:DNA-binding NarL/FixJ family response regulator